VIAALVLVTAIVIALAAVVIRRLRARPVAPADFDREAIDTWECRVAVHEAGHALAAWCCTLVSEVKIATIEAKHGGGTVVYAFLNLPGPDSAWCRAVISLAGVAAEAHVYARWKTHGSKEDIAAALAQAGRARDHDPPWARIGSGASSTLGFQRLFASKLHPSDEVVLEESYRMARRILRAHGGDFFRLVSALLAMRTAREAHLEPILGRRRVARLAAFGAEVERAVLGQEERSVFRARFVLPMKRWTRRAA